LAGLSNSTEDYETITDVLKAVFNFRDQFAHPKLLTSSVMGEESNCILTSIPAVHWERDFDHVAQRFETIKEYCQSLLNTAADQMENASEENDFGRGKYPHLTDLLMEAGLLRGLLHGDAFSHVGP
jgi:hypothetical protein